MKCQCLFSGKNKKSYFKMSFCVEVLRPSQPNGVMSIVISLR